MSDNEDQEDQYDSGVEVDRFGSRGSDAEEDGEDLVDGGDDEEEEDEEAVLRRSMQRMQKGRKPGNASAERERVVSALMKHFGSLVEYSFDENAVRDHRGKIRSEDKVYMKLPDAYRHLSTIFKTLKEPLKNNKDFVTFIAKKNWVHNSLRPLLELCRINDLLTSKNCIRLACLLLEMDDQLVTYLRERNKKVRKTSGAGKGELGHDDGENEDNNEETENAKSGVNDSKKKSIDIQLKTTTGVKLMAMPKASEYMASLHAIKDGLCSSYANDAICNVFKNAWVSEMNSESTNPDIKVDLTLCFIYIRRLFLIEPVPDLMSNAGFELPNALKVHFNYITQLRPILSAIPFICSDLCESVVGEAVKPNSYHNDWLKDVVTILACCLKHFSARDMIDVYKDGKIINMGTDSFDNIDLDSIEKSDNQVIVVPESIQRRGLSSELSKGKLKEMLEKQKENRVTALQGRHSRFGSVYIRRADPGSSGITNNSNSSSNSNSLSNGNGADSSNHNYSKQVTKNPFQKEAAIPEAKSKRNVRNMTFSLESVLDNKSTIEPLKLDEGQKALVVVASMVDMMTNFSENDITSFPGIRHLIKRVNEDKRRDENIIDNASELMFFQILSKCLAYYRLKLGILRKKFEDQSASLALGQNESREEQGWVPNVKNIIDCLNTRTVNRVTATMERLFKIDRDYSQVIHAMEVYKEQICYIKILLESDLEAHNYIAMFNLSRLFYSPSGRLDMLPKLLSAWKPGLYDRKHLLVLIEIVHETMKTLRFAKAKYSNSAAASGDRSKNEKKKKKYQNSDMDAIVVSCHSFDVEEYFRRLVSHHTIRMYTRLLKEYATLEPQTIHYIYIFFQDICKFKIERRSDGKSPGLIEREAARRQAKAAERSESMVTASNMKTFGNSNRNNDDQQPVDDELTLSFLLMNMTTFCVFSDILNDKSIQNNKYFDLLIRLIKSLVRKFVQASSRNHLMFVEILFQHGNPHAHCEHLDNVYDATAFYESHLNNSGRYSSSAKKYSSSDSGSDSYSGSDSDNSVSNSTKKKKSKRDNEASGDSIDDHRNDGSAKKSTRSSSDGATADMGSSASKDTTKRRTIIADDEEEFDIFNSVSSSTLESAALKKTQAKKKKVRSKKPTSGTGALGSSRKKKWTAEEDSILRAQYPIYAGMSSVYDVLSQDADLIAIGNDRDRGQIERRVRELGLGQDGMESNLPDDSFFLSDENDDYNGDNEEVEEEGVDMDSTFPQDMYDESNAAPINIASAVIMSPQNIVQRGTILSPSGLDNARDYSVFDDIFKDNDDVITDDVNEAGASAGSSSTSLLDSIAMDDEPKRKRLTKKSSKVVNDSSDDEL